jgi:hypothetical protein
MTKCLGAVVNARVAGLNYCHNCGPRAEVPIDHGS